MHGPSGSARLSRLARWSARHPVRVLAAWGLVLLMALGASAGLHERLVGGAGEVRGSAAAEAERLIASEFDTPYAQFMVVAFEATSPAADARAAALELALPRLSALPGVTRTRLLPGADRRGAAALVGLDAPSMRETDRFVAPVREALALALPPGTGVRGIATSQAAANLDLARFGSAEASRAEALVLPLSLVALVLACGALGAALVPLISGVAAVVAALGLVGLASHALSLTVFAANAVTMLGLGLGIDYALFTLLALRPRWGGVTDQAGARRAVGEASAHVAPVLVTSAGLAACGLFALTGVPASDLLALGVGGVCVAASSLAAALTLSPALGGLLGRRLAFGRRGSWAIADAREQAFVSRLVGAVLRRKGLAFVLSAGLLVLCASPLARWQIGQPEVEALPAQLPSIQAVRMLEAQGLGGWLFPFRIVVSAPAGQSVLAPARVAAQAAWVRDLRADPRVQHVIALAEPERASRLAAAALLAGPAAVRTRLPEEARGLLSRDGRHAVFQVVLKPEVGFVAGQAFAKELLAVPWASRYPALASGEVRYTGPWMTLAEFIAMNRRVAPWVGLAIMAGCGLLLARMTGSVFLPLKALLANGLTVAGAWGLTVAFFAWGPTAALLGFAAPVTQMPPQVPVIVGCVLFALSMDYEAFLLSGVMDARREGLTGDQALARGIGRSARVITASAAIMAIVFLGFATARMLPLQMLGVALGFGVLLDATITRLVLAPALMGLMGEWNWWPGARAAAGAIGAPARGEAS